MIRSHWLWCKQPIIIQILPLLVRLNQHLVNYETIHLYLRFHHCRHCYYINHLQYILGKQITLTITFHDVRFITFNADKKCSKICGTFVFSCWQSFFWFIVYNLVCCVHFLWKKRGYNVLCMWVGWS